jgi:hypothetical protein
VVAINRVFSSILLVALTVGVVAGVIVLLHYVKMIPGGSPPESTEILGPIEAGQDFGDAKNLAAWSTIDRHALQAPLDVEKDIPGLSQYLVRPARNEREKVRAIYRWLTDRISYDTEGFFSGKYGDVSAEAVLRSRKSICSGYASLFQSLATAAGLRAVVISGFGKGYGYQPGETLKESNHAWNAVQLDGRWYVIDATWGAGFVNDKKMFEKSFHNYYFFPPPDEFILTHFPEDSRWQLLSSPVTVERFHSMVNFSPFPGPTTTLKAYPVQRRLRAGEKISLCVEAPGVVEMSFANGDNWSSLTKTDNTFRGELRPGMGTLKVLGRLSSNDDEFRTFLEYVVE